MGTAELALTLSLLLAFWELTKYLLEGGRVRIRMQAGLLDEYRLTTGRTWAEAQAAWGGNYGGWPVEVAVVEIENLGRTAVTISDVALDLGRVHRRPWRRARRGMKPWPVKAPQALTDTRQRLEPFDSARFVYDVWGGLRPGRVSSRPRRPARVRASVRVAGKRRRRVSSWRRGWRVKSGQLYFLDSGAEIGLAAYRAMWRQTHGDVMARAACIPAALAVRERFPTDAAAPNEDELRDAITAGYFGDEKELLGLVAFYMAEDLEPHYAAPRVKGLSRTTIKAASPGGGVTAPADEQAAP